MNFSLAREIYGNSPWMIDPISFSGLFSILQDFRNGVQLDYDENEKLNSSFALNVESKTKLAFQKWQLNDDDEGVIAVHKINGPITKNGGASSFGMKDVASKMNSMTKDKRVVGHIILSDSGGGSSAAVVFIADAIKDSQAVGKPVVQLIEKGGLNASAMLYMGSFSNFVISEAEDNLIGSIGTMIEMSGFPKQHTDKDGMIHVRAYATASVHKNEEFEQALEGNLEPITSNILDPHNKKFIREVKENRPNVKDEQLTGKIFEAKNVVGTLIDSIGTMDDAISKVLELSTTNINSETKIEQQAQVPKINNNLNNQEMDLKKLRSEHLSVYNEVFALGVESGVKKENDRVGSWMAHSKSDIEAVKTGIDSGNQISAKVREELLIKGASLTHLKDLKSDAAPAVAPKQSGEEEELTADQKELVAFEAKLDDKLEPKKS